MGRLTDASGNEISSVPSVKGAKPVGSQVLVELLTAGEVLGTNLTVSEDAQVGAPQGYVLKMGPKVKVSDYGFDVGDRIVLSGNFTPLPEASNKNGNGRMVACVEPHAIKAVLLEK